MSFEKQTESNEVVGVKNAHQIELAKELFLQEKGVESDHNEVMELWISEGYSQALRIYIEKNNLHQDPEAISKITLEDIKPYIKHETI